MLAHDSLFATEFYTCFINITVPVGVVLMPFYVVRTNAILDSEVFLLGGKNSTGFSGKD